MNLQPIIKRYLPLIGVTVLLAINITSFAVAGKGQAALAAPAVTWPSIRLDLEVNGLDNPTYITHAGDSSGRIFAVEQPGRIRIINGNTLLPTPFLDITDRVLFGGERGLLSAAFPPNYAAKGYFYVYYTKKDGNNVVSRFYTSSNPNEATAASEEPILLLQHPTYENHNGGQLTFGPDGYLYIGTGDGGGSGDPFHNAQNLSSLQGKILRIDVERGFTGQKAGPLPIYFPMTSLNNGKAEAPQYSIPGNNPFLNTRSARPEIWAYGLRNPWRFSFDRSTNNLYIADVGQNLFEEVDVQPPATGGQNYGWNIMEGLHCYASNPCNQAGLTLPALEYAHGSNNSVGCAITGGYVFRGPGNTGMQGFYFYGDYCTGRIWSAIDSGGSWQSQQILDTTYNITSFGEDQAGNLYLVDGGGSIYRVVQGP
jgi:glucose/arabinose dehydrogenase